MVRPPLSAVDEPAWVDALGGWVDETQRLTGNPVALVDVTAQELPALPGALRAAIARDGIVLLGASIVEAVDVA